MARPRPDLFLAMEWIDGEDLATRLGRGPLELGETRDLAASMCGALGVAHARGIVHRDGKTGKIVP